MNNINFFVSYFKAMVTEAHSLRLEFCLFLNYHKQVRNINPEHIKAIMELINKGPYFELLSMKVIDLGIGYSKVEVGLERKHLSPFGILHGGVYSSIIDTAAYWAVYCELDEDLGFTSIDLTVSNLSMVKEGKILVEGRSLKVGRTICLAEASARDNAGKLLAHGTSKMMVLQGLQSISHAVETMGARSLPPKFL